MMPKRFCSLPSDGDPMRLAANFARIDCHRDLVFVDGETNDHLTQAEQVERLEARAVAAEKLGYRIRRLFGRWTGYPPSAERFWRKAEWVRSL